MQNFAGNGLVLCHSAAKRWRSQDRGACVSVDQFANSPHVYDDLERLYRLIALNAALRNGDAHLKNFGIVYQDGLGEARLAPVYDLVTTSVYLSKDSID